MTKIIALSWPGNTGKTTLKKRIVSELSSQWWQILSFDESARWVADDIGTDNMALFQTAIAKKEAERVDLMHTIATDWLFDLILCDRTWIENWAYAIYNMQHWIIDQPVTFVPCNIDYDAVFYFDTPIKQTTTKEFTHYNNKELNDLIYEIVRWKYNNVMQVMSNGMVDGDKVMHAIKDMF